MALTSTEEALVRQLLEQQAAILSLAGNEATITSKLGATKVTLSDLVSASAVTDADLFLMRQGTTDKSVTGAIIKALSVQPDASETVKGIVELATAGETIAGVDTVRAVHPAGLAAVLAGVGATVEGMFKKLSLSATGLSANVTVQADEIVVENASNQYKTLRGVSLTIAGTSVGANGLDTGTIASSTWYSVHVIWNGTTAAGLLSLSATAPTLPSGYTHKARVGWIRTDASGNKYPLAFKQFGRRAAYIVAAGTNVTGYPVMASGVQGSSTTPTWIAVGVSNFVPPTANLIHISSSDGLGGDTALSTNGNHGALTNSANYPPFVSDAGSGGYGGGQAVLVLESTNIYRAASGGHIVCIGWEDNL